MKRGINELPLGDARLTLWLRRAHENQIMEQKLAEIVLETGNDIPVNPRAAPNDPVRLRGVPVVGGRGALGGAIKGTQPLAEVLARERRRQRLSDP